MKATRDWDARTYSRVGTPMAQWGERLIDRLELRGDETVLDAGCGSGGVTAKLLDRLPQGRVIAVDGSPSMVAAAREALPVDRVQTQVCDLTALELDEPVDAVFSNAVFHWISDHDRLFAALHAALRPGGQLVAQCGGEGNIAALKAVMREVGEREPYAEHIADWRPWNYAAPIPTHGPPAPGRLCPGALLAHRGTGRARGRRRLCRHGLPRLAPGPPARGASRRDTWPTCSAARASRSSWTTSA